MHKHMKDTLFEIALCVFKTFGKRDLSFNEHLLYADPKILILAIGVHLHACFRH